MRDAPTTVPGPLVLMLVCGASLREMVRRRTFVFLFLVCAIPFTLTAIWRIWGIEHVDAPSFFTNLTSAVYLQLLVYIVALAFGVPALHSEVQGRTLTYLFTRPIHKFWIYAGRLLAAQITAGLLLAASLMVCFAVIVAGNASVIDVEFLRAYVNHVFLVLVATVCATGVCSLFGTLLKRPDVWAILYCFGWEVAVSKFPTDLRLYTVNFHVRNLLFDDADVVAGLMDAVRTLLFPEVEVSATSSAFALLLIFVGAAAIGGWSFGRKEYVIG